MNHYALLTFDDGPGPSTSRLLDVLKKHRARATFFLLGRNIQGAALHGDQAAARAIAERAAREGHLLGNHTMSHSLAISSAEFAAEVEACDALLRDIYRGAGRPAPQAIPVRLPYGPWHAPHRLAACQRTARSHCHWSGDLHDWQSGRNARAIAADLVAHLRQQWKEERIPVVLLHDAGPGAQGGDAQPGVSREATVEAMDLALATLASSRVRFLTPPECDPEVWEFVPP
jgi:peptidoglycan/xylan/chitin deacetylase (PgdA/CDA1 family)